MLFLPLDGSFFQNVFRVHLTYVHVYAFAYMIENISY